MNFLNKNLNPSLAKILAQYESVKKVPTGRRLTHYQSETALELGNLSLTFDYKREKITTTLNPHTPLNIYLQPEGKRLSRFFPLNSGQGAIFLTLSWLKNFTSESRIHSPFKAYVGYHEASQLLGFHTIYHPELAAKVDTRWICSSSFDSSFTLPASHQPRFVVVDTTCWPLECDELKSIIDHYPDSYLFLVRSHSKLDMGGVEYGSLGSLCLLSPQSQQTNFDEISNQLELLIKLIALAPSIDDIPPYLFDPEFIGLNNQRIANIKSETIRIKNSLDNFGPRLSFPEHGMFFFLILPSSFGVKRHNALIKALMRFLLDEGTVFKRLPSFGFNFIAITPYVDFNTSELIIRFSPSIDPIENDKLIRTLGDLKSLGLLSWPLQEKE